jgi:hypothetical protein
MLRLKSGTVLKLKTYFADTKVCDTIFRLKFEIDLVPYSKYVTQISRKYAPSQIGPYYEYVPQNSRACKRKYIFFSAPLEFWSHRLAVRTPGFHPGNRSSILRGITNIKASLRGAFILAIAWWDHQRKTLTLCGRFSLFVY